MIYMYVLVNIGRDMLLWENYLVYQLFILS